MEQLYSLCQAKNKVWKTIPNGMHNNTVAEPRYFEYIIEFIDKVVR